MHAISYYSVCLAVFGNKLLRLFARTPNTPLRPVLLHCARAVRVIYYAIVVYAWSLCGRLKIIRSNSIKPCIREWYFVWLRAQFECPAHGALESTLHNSRMLHNIRPNALHHIGEYSSHEQQRFVFRSGDMQYAIESEYSECMPQAVIF